MAVKLELLTDESIIDYTSRGNKNHVITDHRDVNLQSKPFIIYRGGLYDVDIFGSPYEDRCICGKIRTTSSQPCPNCGAIVYPKEEGLRRFARIELSFYYLSDLRYDVFNDFIGKVFSDTTINRKFSKSSGYSTSGGRRFTMKMYDSCQFDYDPTTKSLTVTDIITDESKCSYEGLIKIFEENFPDELSQLKEFINKLYIVMPAVMRPFSFNKALGKSANIPYLTAWYKLVVRLCSVKDRGSNALGYERVIKQFKSPGERVKYTAILRAFLNSGKREATELLNTSKENLARGLYAFRNKNSMRSPIIPSTTLPVDEVGIPVHLAYEMGRSGFIKELMNTYNYTEEEATRSTRYESLNPELQERFKEYFERQVVIINRPPTLHEYNLIALKPRLNNRYAIDLPIQLCSPLAGDFDGDQIAVHLVPEEVKDDVYRKMSPRYVTKYKKNLEPINVPSHETLNGLAVATSISYDEESEKEDPHYYYDSYAELLKDVEVNKKIELNRLVKFSGKVGELEYHDQVTTLGRLRISKIINADIDSIPGVIKDKLGKIDAGAVARLVLYMQQFPDYVERMRDLQEYALKVVTRAGVITFDFDNLYAETNNATYEEIKKIADDPNLTDQQKLLLMTDKYKKYISEVKETIRSDVKKDVKDANRVKIDSIIDMVAPAMIISGVDEKPIINRTRMIAGMSSKDYIYHAIRI